MPCCWCLQTSKISKEVWPPDTLSHKSQPHANHDAAMRPKEVSDRLQLEKIAKDHVWKVEPSCATTGEGIFEGLVRPNASQIHQLC
jgi:hypothetical protein